MDRRALFLGTIGALAVYGLVFGAARARADDERTLTARADGAAHVTVDLPLGNTTVRTTDVDTVSAELRVRGSGATVAGTHLTATRSGDTVAVVVTFPQRVANHLGAILDVTIPRTATVRVVDRLGNVTVDGTAGAEIIAYLGNVHVTSVRGTTSATSRMGNVDAEIAPGWSGRDLEFTSNMGNVTLRVPEGFRARYDAQTSMGRARVNAPSVEGGTPVRVRSAMGNVAVDRS